MLTVPLRRDESVRELADECRPDSLWRGLAVVLLADAAPVAVADAERVLDALGFEALVRLRVDPARYPAVARVLGNETAGAAGASALCLVAYDVAAREPADGRPSRRTLEAAAGLGPSCRVSRNPHQALAVLEAVGGSSAVERIASSVEALLAAVAFPYPVVRVLPAEARRARVAVVAHPVHGEVVCKVFRPGAQRFFRRELQARTELADLPEMPELLESGDRWFLTPLYGDDGGHVRRRLPRRSDVQLKPFASRALARLARDLHERGLFLLDLSSKNVLSDPRVGLKVLDLEFLQEYSEARPPLAESYTFRGLPPGAVGYDVPSMSPRALVSDRIGNSAFHPAVAGLGVDALLLPDRLDRAVRLWTVQLAWYSALVVGSRARSALGWLSRQRRPGG